MVALRVTKTDDMFLQEAVDDIVKTLATKKDSWATGMEVFECFDAQQELGTDPLEFAIMMCNLKMVRLKSCLNRRRGKQNPYEVDPDLDDTLKDLAGYALLARGLYKRQVGNPYGTQVAPPVSKEVNDIIEMLSTAENEYKKNPYAPNAPQTPTKYKQQEIQSQRMTLPKERMSIDE